MIFLPLTHERTFWNALRTLLHTLEGSGVHLGVGLLGRRAYLCVACPNAAGGFLYG